MQNDTSENVDNEKIPLQPVRRVAGNHSPTRKSNNAHVVHILSQDETADLRELGLMAVLKPMVYSSIAFGLVWKRNHSKCCDIYTVHSCILLPLMWFQVIRYFAGYGKDDRYGGVLFQKIIAHGWACQFALGTTVYMYSKYKNIPSFLMQWENYKIKYGGLTFSFMKRFIFRRVMIVNLVATPFMLLTAVTWIVFRPKLLIKWLFPFVEYEESNALHQTLFVVYSLLICYSFLVWLQPALNTHIYCSLLKMEFKQLSDQLSTLMQEKKEESKSSMNGQIDESIPFIDDVPTTATTSPVYRFECEHYRTRYISLCQLVRKLDDVLNGYLLILYGCSIPMVILLLYGTWEKVSYENDRLSATLGINSLIYCVALLISITSVGSSLAETVSPSEIITSQCCGCDLSAALFVEGPENTSAFLTKAFLVNAGS